jgi:hypothetical protein
MMAIDTSPIPSDLMDADLELLLTTGFVTVDDLLPDSLTTLTDTQAFTLCVTSGDRGDAA